MDKVFGTEQLVHIEINFKFKNNIIVMEVKKWLVWVR